MLDELYQDVIMDHSSRAKLNGRLNSPTHSARGYNPICGDEIIIDIEKGEGGHIVAVGFESTGCAISKAATSVMTERINQKSERDIEAIMNRFFEITTQGIDGMTIKTDGDIAAFFGIRNYPSRIKCANLPWHTLRAALAGEKIATTE